MEKLKSKDKLNAQKALPVVSTAQDSYVFVKELTNLAISSILYMRKILPNTEFESKVFGGMKLWVLKEETGHVGTERIKSWLTGAFDALKRKYLRKMMLEIRDARSDSSLEIYTVTIGYEVENESISISKDGEKIFSKDSALDDIQFQTMRLLQICYTITKCCTNLPDQVSIRMWLSFRENTPPYYQPTWYRACQRVTPGFAANTRTIEIGIVNTNHHIFEFITKTCLCDENTLPKGRKPRTKPFSKNTSCQVKSKKCDVNKIRNTKSVSSVSLPTTESTSETLKKLLEEESQSNSQSTNEGSQSDSVRCPCHSQRKTSVMYQCSGCGYWAHANCFGIILSDGVPALEVFHCQICHKTGRNYTCHDGLMVDLKTAADQQKLAIRRRLLGFCTTSERSIVSVRKIQKVSGLVCHPELLQGILEELIKKGIIEEKSRDIFLINKDRALKDMPNYFYLTPLSTKLISKKRTALRGNVSPSKKRKLRERKVNIPSRIMPSRKAKNYR